MTTPIRAAYDQWPMYDARLREVVAGLSEEQLARRSNPDGWPAWAIVGHLACQRVFWLCDFAGEAGAETTPFPNAGYDCPGDDDLEHVWSADRLVDALAATFRIVDRVLDGWTVESLGEVVRRPEWDDSWVHTRAAVVQRVLAHDVYHISELGQALGVGLEIWP
jgi:DinB family protein